MQNAQIWRSIESLCDEAESVIKNSDPVTTVIQSFGPPAFLEQRPPHTNTVHIFSSKPAPPKAEIRDRPTPQENVLDTPLSPATMTEIAAAIDRASQTAKKPQIMDRPSQGINDQLRKDLMIEVSLAVRSVLENELPKIVRHAVSESLYEVITSSTDSVASDKRALKKKAPEKRAATKKTPPKKNAVKKTKAQKNIK